MSASVSRARPNYGVDAPGVMRGLIGAGLLCLAARPLGHRLGIGPEWLLTVVFGMGIVLTAEGVLMLTYAWWGKFRHRDRMLARIPWRGDERVLDVGTGRGLLMIGAAKRLTTGTSVGIDIWKAEDLSGNSPENAKKNAENEGVASKVEVRSEDVRALSFPAESFDVVLSNLCLHNIEDDDGRVKACREIARVLKPGGLALISDFRATDHYAKAFSEAGFAVDLSRGSILESFPPLRIVAARKPPIPAV